MIGVLVGSETLYTLDYRPQITSTGRTTNTTFLGERSHVTHNVDHLYLSGLSFVIILQENITCGIELYL